MGGCGGYGQLNQMQLTGGQGSFGREHSNKVFDDLSGNFYWSFFFLESSKYTQYQAINHETTSWSFPSYLGLILFCFGHPRLHEFQLFGRGEPVEVAILAVAFDWVAAIAVILDSSHCGVNPRASPTGDAATKTPENRILFRGVCVRERIENIIYVVRMYMRETARFILRFLNNIVESRGLVLLTSGHVGCWALLHNQPVPPSK